MTETLKFDAIQKDSSGTGSARNFRREGKVPAVIYGKGYENKMVAISLNKFNAEYQKGGIKTKLVEINLDGKSITTLPKAIQLDPVSDLPIHIDLLAIGKDSLIEVAVAVHALNAEKSPGVKKGGALNIAHRQIKLRCHPSNIPHHIDIDVSGIDIGQSIHIEDITLPEGVEPVERGNFTILSLVGRSEEKESEESSEGATEEAEK